MTGCSWRLDGHVENHRYEACASHATYCKKLHHMQKNFATALLKVMTSSTQAVGMIKKWNTVTTKYERPRSSNK